MSIVRKLKTKEHIRENFDCENEQLNNYLKRQASQDVKKKLAACFVMTDEKNNITGYYTLSNGSIPRDELPEKHNKKIPLSYDVPVTLLGRLAIDKSLKGKGFGGFLLIDAMKRSYEIQEEIASMAMVTDPIDENAVGFYENYDFVKLANGRLFLPMTTIKKTLDEIT